MKKFVLVLLFAFFSSALLVFSQETKVLFIGNSLTNYGNTVGKVQSFVEEGGKDAYLFNGCINGVRLAEHVNHSSTIANIQAEQWDYVVLQGSNYDIAIPELRINVYGPILDLKAMILENNPDTKIIFFMDWAMKNGVSYNGINYGYFEFQDMLYEGTLIVANDINMMIAPIGWAWKQSITEHPEINLFHNDNGHPGNKGAYLNACVYYSVLFQESVEGFEFIDTLPADEALYLQKTGSDMVLNDLELWNIEPLTTYAEKKLIEEIEVLPNPANTNFTIACPVNHEISKVSLLNYNGKSVQEFSKSEINSGNFGIDNLKSGNYLLQIIIDNIEISKKLTIIK